MHNEPYDFFMLRRAAMPNGELTTLHQRCGDDFQKWEAALLELCQTEPFRQAIWLASPSLEAAVEAYDKQAPEKSRRKVLFSLYKYLIRISARATPFGLFSVTGAGALADHSKLSGPAISEKRKTIRLQINALTHIARWLDSQQPSGQTRYVANSSLHLTPTGYRYIEIKKSGQTTEPVISEVDGFPELILLLQAAKTPQTKIELAKRLKDAFTPDQSSRLIQDLIDSGLLVSELSPNATGPDFEDRVKACLDEYRQKSRQAQQLYELVCGLSSQDSTAGLQGVARELAGLIPALSTQQLFRAQISATQKGLMLGKKAVAKLAGDFAAIKGLLRSSEQLSPLTVLKQKFRASYGYRLLPLCEVLESEMGMQYARLAMQEGKPPTLLTQLEFSQTAYTAALPETAASRIKQQILDQALSEQLYQIEIQESDLKTLTKQPSQERGFYWLGEILASSAKNIDRGYFQFYLKAAGGQSGLELMARFAQNDPLLAAYLSDASRALAELDRESIHAEIAHVPEIRTAAVVSRPHLWPYEIPYLSHSVMPASRQIAVSDILVSISEDESFILTSKSLAKRIIPHNTTAHNYSLGLPVYQFLSDVANQDSQLMAWDWEHLASFSFLPRVLFHRLILSPAQWNLSGETRQKILDALDTDEHWNVLLSKLRIPRMIQICQGDNLLLIDFESRFARALFKAELQKTGHLKIQEYLQSSASQPVEDKAGRYSHELVLAFKPAATQALVSPPAQMKEQRLFHLASQWLYVKIFLPAGKADRLLTTSLATICEQLTSEGHLKKWFYVRYFDPSHHLRIRLELARPECWHLALDRIQTSLEGSAFQGVIEKIQTDTYERELERYHSLDFEKVESIFYQDSLACIKVVSLLESETDDQARWLAALYGADVMLDDFGLSVNEKAAFAKVAYQNFLSEFGQDQALTRQLDYKYRQHRMQIQQTLTSQALLPLMLDGCFKERSEQIRVTRTTTITRAEISSYVHMFLNRILESNHRKQEMILFHFLSKYYQSAAKLCTNRLIN
ncbi:lantibiotic dehydratase [Dyadobacter endophyticus]|uniref:Lantibiotic dehydratase n=1 Tax=Dyadobacter endophyticus TaxID=1749036 RepID=A0ABQ1YDK0_9BACT|nr:lantibiotic dehydratase [Dyadobacter endophyticus]GGH20545.1 lantibiotic dehydratase [Dyadobacter endophyticus]